MVKKSKEITLLIVGVGFIDSNLLCRKDLWKIVCLLNLPMSHARMHMYTNGDTVKRRHAGSSFHFFRAISPVILWPNIFPVFPHFSLMKRDIIFLLSDGSVFHITHSVFMLGHKSVTGWC